MTRPAVVVNPAVRFGRPTMSGISTEMIADMYWAGEDVEAEYGLTRHELLVTLWFEGSQGQPRFRRRWKTWAEQTHTVLWSAGTLNPDTVPLPPTNPT